MSVKIVKPRSGGPRRRKRAPAPRRPAAARSISDVCVIFRDEDAPSRWVAHGVLTDQVGVGSSVLNAYTDLLRNLATLARAATEDATIRVYALAPREIRERLARATKLPDDIVEIARLQVFGDIPVAPSRQWKYSPRVPVMAPLEVRA